MLCVHSSEACCCTQANGMKRRACVDQIRQLVALLTGLLWGAIPLTGLYAFVAYVPASPIALSPRPCMLRHEHQVEALTFTCVAGAGQWQPTPAQSCIGSLCNSATTSLLVASMLCACDPNCSTHLMTYAQAGPGGVWRLNYCQQRRLCACCCHVHAGVDRHVHHAAQLVRSQLVNAP